MKRIRKIDLKQAKSLNMFRGHCGCTTCADCNSTSSQAIALMQGAQADYNINMELTGWT